MRRRPLLRAAAVGGGAYYAGKRRAETEQAEPESQQQAPAPASAPAQSGGISTDSLDRLAQLGKLHDQGVLTDEEFAQGKEKVLG